MDLASYSQWLGRIALEELRALVCFPRFTERTTYWYRHSGPTRTLRRAGVKIQRYL